MNPVIISVAGIRRNMAYASGSEGKEKHQLPEPYGIDSIPKLFAYPVKHLGRFPPHVKAGCGACALSLKAAGMKYKEGELQDVGLLAAGFEPTLNINYRFFKDYIDAGRTMGRGNLFIYTLPTGTIAEVSIHFRFGGPALYIDTECAPLENLLEEASQTLQEGECGKIITIWQDAENTLCLTIAPERGKRYCHPGGYERIQNLASGWKTPDEAMKYFEFT